MSVCPRDVMNLSCFPKTLGSEPRSKPGDSEGGVLTAFGIAIAVLVLAVGGFLVWWFKYRKLQYLLRICLFLFSITTLLPILRSYGIVVPEQYDYSCLLWKLSFKCCLVLAVVRWYWRMPVNIIVCLTEETPEKRIKNDYNARRNLKNKTALLINVSKIPPVYPNYWIPIYEVKELPRGVAVGMTALGQRFCIFRGAESGEVYVLEAFCPHLGADLSAGGTVKGDCVVCPFHGWHANGSNGICTPPRGGITARTKKWISREINGHIFVWHHAEEDRQTPTWEIPRIEEVCNGEWIYRGRTEHEVICHIQEIPENGADLNHLNILHSPSVFMGRKWMDTKSWLNVLNHHWEPKWSRDPNTPHIARITLKQTTTLLGYRLPWGIGDLELNIEQIGPATVHLHIKSFFGRGVLLQHITPEGPLFMRVIHQLYTEPSFAALPAALLLRAEAIMFERIIATIQCKDLFKDQLHTVDMCPECPVRENFIWYHENFFSENSPNLWTCQERTLEF